MQPMGFKLVDAFALEVQGVFLDLHNDYELSEVRAEFGTNSLRLSWSRSVQEHVSPGLPLAVHLIVKGAKGMRSLPPKDNWEAGGGRTPRSRAERCALRRREPNPARSTPCRDV
jgi:hypothetical protein